MPTGGTGSGFGFAVSDDAGDDQIGIVVGRAVGVQKRVAEFAAFVNGAGSFRRDVTGNSVGPGELAEQPLDSVRVEFDVGVDLRVRAFEVGVRNDAGTTVARADDVHHIKVALGDDAIEMRVDEVQARGGPPVAKQAWLYVIEGERTLEERIVFEVDLANREVVGGAPVRMHRLELIVGQRGRRRHFRLLRRVSLEMKVCNSAGPCG